MKLMTRWLQNIKKGLLHESNSTYAQPLIFIMRIK